jgi:hypothetical protein
MISKKKNHPGIVKVWLAVRVTRKVRVEFFGFSIFQVSKTAARHLQGKNKTRNFGYPAFRIRVYPNYPNCRGKEGGGWNLEGGAWSGQPMRRPESGGEEEGVALESMGGGTATKNDFMRRFENSSEPGRKNNRLGDGYILLTEAVIENNLTK